MYQTQSKCALGIDPGLANCGWAVIGRTDKGHFRFMESGCIQTDRQQTHAQRLFHIYDDIRQRIHRSTPNLVVIEKVYFNKNVSSAITTGGVIGVCLLAAEQAGISSHLITPQQAKAAATGTGRASKDATRRCLARLLGQEIPNHHEADAAALAIAGLLQLASVHS